MARKTSRDAKKGTRKKPAPKRRAAAKAAKAAAPRGRAAEARAAEAQPSNVISFEDASRARGKYVYCIIQATDALRFGHIGIGADPAEVHTVNYRNIAAVVSDTPIELLDPTRENVLAHERV